MAITQTPKLPLCATRVTKDTAATNSSVKNIDLTATNLLSVHVDNSSYATLVYWKAWDHVDPVVGTTPPDYQVPIPANGNRTIHLRGNLSLGGVRMKNGLSYAVTTDPGTTGNSAPATPPTIYIRSTAGVV